MKKLTKQDGKSLDMVNENTEVLKAIFPEAFTEDGLDFEVLRELLGDTVAEGEEKYGLTWHGKKKARQFVSGHRALNFRCSILPLRQLHLNSP